MEQTIARHSERLDDHDREIKDLKATAKENAGRIDSVERNATTMEKDIAIILNDNIHMRESLVKIEAGVDSLRKSREEDHFIKPLHKHESRSEQMYKWIVGGIVGVLVGVAMTAILSNIAL